MHTLAADKLFHIVEGDVTLVVGENTRMVGRGPVFVPAGTPHRYLSDSGAPARMTVTVIGRGQVEFLRGMSRLNADGPPDPTAVAEHTRAHGVVILPA